MEEAGERASARRCRVLLAEFVDAAGCVDDLLLARIEGVAARAHFDLQVMTQRRTRLEAVTARAGDGDLFVLGMDRRFHGTLDCVEGPRGPRRKRRGSLVTEGGPCKHFGATGPAFAVTAVSGDIEAGIPAWTQAFPYPQKLWISLWIQVSGQAGFTAQIALLLLWLKFSHPISPILVNGLQRRTVAI